MGTAMSPTTLLLDLDGVLRLWPNDYATLETEHNLPAGSIGEVAFESNLLEQVITGRITDDQWRDEIRSSLADSFPAGRVQEAVSAWSKPVGSVCGDVLHLVIQARRVFRIGLITNATDRLPRDLATLGLLKHLDFVVNSSEVGFAKPDPKIFQYALSRISALPAEVAFVDDTPSNVAAASSLGIRTHHFTTVGSLRAFMQSIGVPSNAA